ncbi:hypothetical protein M9H77_18825 [Catharanthus roseus]|uniref:Uncharacterized protein n=1 Tax=Catharanthus roseus TaxID=4058 RepID=A0ACC0B8I0_CATRO|nr:hypothetical protein M9H77_18825 [Catharanthus roseus]
MDPILWSVRMTMRVLSFYEEHHIFYFTLYSINNDNKMCYLWTIVLIEFIPIQPHTISITHDTNTINMMEHVTTMTQMISDQPSMLYPTVDEDDDENDHSDEDYVVSTASESDNNNDAEEEELQTPRYLSQTSSKKCKYYFKRVVRTRGHVAVNDKHIHCLVLMLLQFVEKMVREQTLMAQDFGGKWIIEIRILPQDVADVVCRDIIEKIIITLVQAI